MCLCGTLIQQPCTHGWCLEKNSACSCRHSVQYDKNTILTDFQLIKIFTKVENIINICPLIHVSEEHDDLEALTPNHFLIRIV